MKEDRRIGSISSEGVHHPGDSSSSHSSIKRGDEECHKVIGAEMMSGNRKNEVW
jgi:hypothetical protein